MTLQAALSEVQDEARVLRGQVASQQHHIKLLGGNLQGRLSLVQGSVLADMQAQVSAKDAALQSSAHHVRVIQSQLEELGCAYAAKLAAEQAERKRLAAETAQVRLLCTARGRQIASLQEQLQQEKDAAAQAHQAGKAARDAQQQQLASLQEQLQEAQLQLAVAQQDVAEARQAAAGADGGNSGLRQQIDEVQELLADKQLQIEWLESKVHHLEGSDTGQQVRGILASRLMHV